MKLWAGRFQKQTDELVNDFNASISFDQRLYKQDITGSMAHAQMLCDCGILTAQDNEKIQQGLTELLPVRGAKKQRRAEERTVFLIKRGDTLAVRQRPDTGLLAKLTEFPNVGGNLDASGAEITLAQWGLTAKRIVPAGTAKHVFTHIEWQMKGYFAEVEGDNGAFRWVTRAELDALAFPTAFKAYTEKAKKLF